jgi:hypothetical protein
MAFSSASHSDNSSVIDLTLSDEDTVELPPNSPSIEVLNTDDCPKVRFPEEIPAEILDAFLRHYYSGKRGISPVVCVHGAYKCFVNCIRMLRVLILILFNSSVLFICRI